MGFFSKFENTMEDAIDDLGDKFFDSPISPVQIAKKAEKQMRRNKMLGAGKQFAPTLYTVLVNPKDDSRLFGYYPTLAGETETYLKAKANENGLAMDGDPLVRFIVDEDLKSGKFDVIAEAVAGDIIVQLRAEENERYGLASKQMQAQSRPQAPAVEAQPAPQKKMSSAFASAPLPSEQASKPAVQEAVQSAPALSPKPAPAPAATPQASPAPAPVPTPAPQAAADVNKSQNDKVQPAPVAAPSSPTMVFAGNFDSVNQKTQGANAAIPAANLRDNGSGRLYTLNSATCVIGRETTCNIVLSDANASRQHAQITYNGGL